jgi:uncharacterized protein
MTIIPVASLYIACFALLVLALSGRVMQQRWQCRVAFGDGGTEAAPLRRAMRAQGNAVEYLPISALVLVACELAGMSHGALHLWGTVLLLARIAHAVGISRAEGTSPLRAGGILVQITFLTVLPLWLILHSAGHQ